MPNNSPNMGLPVPIVAVDSGLVWEQSVDSSLSIIDQHNHSSGGGVQINPSGLNINSDLPINNNNLTLIRSARFNIQGSALSGASDLGCLYVSGVDLYFNDENGNQIQITSGGSVNATSSGISSGTATASFVSSVLVVNSASNTPANIQGASLLLGNNSSGTKYLTLSPPNSMANSYGLILPSIPASASFVTLDTSGNLATASNISAVQIASNSITRAQISSSAFTAPTIQQFTSGSGTYTTPTSPAPLYLRVRMVGGGGGGGGGGTIASNGSAGGTTTFGTSFLTCTGGAGGTNPPAKSAGGTATIVGLTGIAVSGGGGSATFEGNPPASSIGGCGGSSALGGAGVGGDLFTSNDGQAGGANTGGGGGGGAGTSGTVFGGAGGGAGAYIDVIVPSPSSTYTYTVGAAGASGSGNQSNGGAGGSGMVIVQEFYQ